MPALATSFSLIKAPPDASEAAATRLAALWKLARTNRCRIKGSDRPSLEVAAQNAGLQGDAYHWVEGSNGKKRKGPLKNNEYLVARILQLEGHESAIPAGWLQCQPVGKRRTMAIPMAATGSVTDLPSVPPE